MQYLVLLPGLAMVDRSKLFIQSPACVYPKPDPNDTQNHTQSAPSDQLVTKQAEQVVYAAVMD